MDEKAIQEVIDKMAILEVANLKNLSLDSGDAETFITTFTEAGPSTDPESAERMRPLQEWLEKYFASA